MRLFLSSSHLYKKFAFRKVSNFSSSLCERVGHYSLVGIGTCHGLDGQGIEFWWGRGFSCPSSLALESSLLCSVYWLSFCGVKWPRIGIKMPIHL